MAWPKDIFKLFAACLLWQYVIGASLRDRTRHHRNTRQDVPYYWMCPDVVCAPVSESCESIEYLVFQYDYEIRGRVVNVRCESCEYCLDGPNRQRRHTISSACPTNIDCPELPARCTDERLTDVIVNNVVCKRCPACYDNTVVNTHFNQQ